MKIHKTNSNKNISIIKHDYVNDSIPSLYELWMPTAYLRYAKQNILFNEQSVKYELRLQQKWVNTMKKKEKWEFIKEVEI